MNREQYMKMLRKYLRRLPKEDFKRAIEYYEEYFEEAGIEHEAQAVSDLGTPEEAADSIIQNFAIENAASPVKSVKKGVNAAWVGVLAVFVAPVTLPVLFVATIMMMLVVLIALLVVVIMLALGVAVVISGPVTIIAGFTVLPESIPTAMVCIGYGLCGIGLGLLIINGVGMLCRKLLQVLVKFFGRLAKRGGKNA